MNGRNDLIRTKDESDLMRKSGEITARALKKAIGSVYEGQTKGGLNGIVDEEIRRLGGEPSFKKVPNYFWATCLTVNDEVVHGIPDRTTVLKNGDLISIDLGVIYRGWYTDAAWSVVVGGETNQTHFQKKFLQVGEEAMWKAISRAVSGHRTGDISSAMQQTIEKAGFSVVRSLSGHGVGRSYHEEPEVPTYGVPGKGFYLKSGMTLAIEAIYTSGKGEIYQKADGWTIATTDGSLAGLFEMTVIVGNKPEVITDWRQV